MSITGSRLAVLLRVKDQSVWERRIVVLDWRSSGDKRVRYSLYTTTTSSTQPFTQELPVDDDTTMEFIDESRLLFTLEAKDGKPAALVMTDTSNLTEATTTFLLPSTETCRNVRLQLEKDAHTQSSDEPTAPFHNDPNQRLIVLTTSCRRFLVFPVGALLGHHKDSEVEWHMWKGSVATPSDLVLHRSLSTWVSGSRLFAASLNHPQTKMWVYDFSVEGRKLHLRRESIQVLGGVRSLRYAEKRYFPQIGQFVSGTRDSLLLFNTLVSATVSLSLC